MKYLILISIIFFCHLAYGKIIRTNAAFIHNAPSWMKETEINAAIDKIQKKLEWRTRRINIYYHDSKETYAKSHNLSGPTMAVAVKSEEKQEIHLSPNVNPQNYLQTLTHEMVHIIFYQKYRGAIPQWLEEGFANNLSRKTPVNYEWLRKQKLPEDITKMTHPFSEQASIPSSVHYSTSQAIVEMLNKKCNMENLLRLSVQNKMQDYIKTYCGIDDINTAFRYWVRNKK